MYVYVVYISSALTVEILIVYVNLGKEDLYQIKYSASRSSMSLIPRVHLQSYYLCLLYVVIHLEDFTTRNEDSCY